MSVTKARPSKDATWLRRARADLASNGDVWAVKPDQHGGISKAQAIGHYLDLLLTDLGEPSAADLPHPCSFCGKTHDPVSDDTEGAG